MDIEAYKDAVANADMAFANGKYQNAVSWYDKALKEAPDDEYCLSKAGTALVSMSRFEEAFVYFQRAVDADPKNGDNVFNLANAYFFSGDIPKAIEYYTAAELLECSDDVAARIYYQLALMCSIKRDYKAALINYQKYEDADKTGQAALDTDLISERVNIYIQLEDYDNALKYTLKWVNLAPSDIRAYLVYFNLLTATEKYEKALKVLDDAEKYAVKNDIDKYSLDISRANLYMNAAGSSLDKNDDFNQKAYDMLNELIVGPVGDQDSKNQLVLSLGELCISMGRVDEAIELMKMLLQKPEPEEDALPEKTDSVDTEIDPAEIDAMMDSDIAEMEERVSSGEISDDLGDDVPVNFDENGDPVRDYPDGIFGTDENGYQLPEFKGIDLSQAEKQDAEEERADHAEAEARINYILLTCYAFKDDYENTLKYARIVKNTQGNTYYEYFGRYSEAYAMMQLAKQGRDILMEDAQRKYSEQIAFFRAEMLKMNVDSAYALLFRARMYAELGKYAKAEELSELMSDQDRKSLLEYINECRESENKS